MTIEHLNVTIEHQLNRLVDSGSMSRKGCFRSSADGEDGIFELHGVAPWIDFRTVI
jgi:hypothetical protein